MSIASIVLLNFHVNVTSGGFASSSHGILAVSCRATPNTFIWPWWQTGVTGKKKYRNIDRAVFDFAFRFELKELCYPRVGRYFLLSSRRLDVFCSIGEFLLTMKQKEKKKEKNFNFCYQENEIWRVCYYYVFLTRILCRGEFLFIFIFIRRIFTLSLLMNFLLRKQNILSSVHSF